MRQILQSLKTGDIRIADVPCPSVRPKHLLIETNTTLISAGTERMLLDFGKANLLQKARQQPDKVREVFDKVRTDGLMPTLEAVQSKMDQPLPLGYCNAGTVMEVGPGVSGFQPGDRVVSNGHHADVVCVPQNLCAKIPPDVSFESASFTVIASIALQGIRLAKPTLGERVAVMGLGLVGLMTVQLLRAHGCQVLGIDFNQERLKLARDMGAAVCDLSQGQDPVKAGEQFTNGRGMDAVLLTAATKSSEPVHQAATMSRKRGRIVLVGVVGLELSRADFYEKELTFQVSCSYGPGRYDDAYEKQGHDYPLPFVRWTEQRNFEAVLDMMSDGRVEVNELITHRFGIDKANSAYNLIAERAPSLGILLEFAGQHAQKEYQRRAQTIRLADTPSIEDEERFGGRLPGVSFIGAGNFTSRVLLPAFRTNGARFRTIASAGGLTAQNTGEKFGFQSVTSDANTVFEDDETDIVVITTQHDSHADFVCRAIAAGKNVFVEKPLAINETQLKRVIKAWECRPYSSQKLMVGFNRRFAPQVQKMHSIMQRWNEPTSMIMTVNAGAIPIDHWTQSLSKGGGRIIGEACHFVDLLRFLTGSPIQRVHATQFGQSVSEFTGDKVTTTLEFANGSFATIHYLANGHKSFAKERLEVFCGGRVLQLDNFRKLSGFGVKGFRKMNLWKQDKGHVAEVDALLSSVISAGPNPIPFLELVEVTRTTFAINEARRTGFPCERSGQNSNKSHRAA